MSVVVVGAPWNPGYLGDFAAPLLDAGHDVVVADTAVSLRSLLAPVGVSARTVPELAVGSVADVAREAGATAVVSLTEMRLELAAEVREALGLPGNRAVVEHRVRDKSETRAALANFAAERFWRVRASAVTDLVRKHRGPFVLKPLDFAGSNGVSLVRGPEDVAQALEPFQGDDPLVLVEGFIPGAEYSVEGLVVGGRLRPYAVVEKVTSGASWFQELAHLVPSGLGEAQTAAALAFAGAAVAVLGVDACPVHVELKDDGGRWRLVELHTRAAGGHIPELVRLATGRDLLGDYGRLVAGTDTGARAALRETAAVVLATAGVGSEQPPPAPDLHDCSTVKRVAIDRTRRSRLKEFGSVRLRFHRVGEVILTGARDEVLQDVRRLLPRLNPAALVDTADPFF